MIETRKLPSFDSEGAAWAWLEEQVDDPCVDNYRLYYSGDSAGRERYNRRKDSGCCGSFDQTVIICGLIAYIGCNYGH